jgi:hypothetical protein
LNYKWDLDLGGRGAGVVLDISLSHCATICAKLYPLNYEEVLDPMQNIPFKKLC